MMIARPDNKTMLDLIMESAGEGDPVTNPFDNHRLPDEDVEPEEFGLQSVQSGRRGYTGGQLPPLSPSEQGKNNELSKPIMVGEVVSPKVDPFREYRDSLNIAQEEYEQARSKYRGEDGQLKDTSGWKGNIAHGAKTAPTVDMSAFLSGRTGLGSVVGANLGLALGGMAKGLADPTADEAVQEQSEMSTRQQKVEQARQILADAMKNRESQARITNYESLEKDRQGKRDLNEKKRLDAISKEEARVVQKRTQTLADIYNRSKVWDSNSATAQQFEKELGVTLPSKTGKETLKQDVATGAWWIHQDGKAIKPAMTGDGKPWVTTAPLVAERVKDDFKTDSKERLQTSRLKLTQAHDMRIANIKIANQNSDSMRRAITSTANGYLEKDVNYQIADAETKARMESEAVERAIKAMERISELQKK